MKNKKSVTPILAWILLVGLAVAMGAFVSNWAIKQAQNQAQLPEEIVEQSEYCESVAFTVEDITVTDRYGAPDNYVYLLELTIKNRGLFTLEKLKLDLADVSTTTTYDCLPPSTLPTPSCSFSPLSPKESENTGTASVTINPPAGSISLTAIIKPKEKEILCVMKQYTLTEAQIDEIGPKITEYDAIKDQPAQ